MFGPRVVIKSPYLAEKPTSIAEITLRPHAIENMSYVAEMLSDYRVVQYTNILVGYAPRDEEEYFERWRTSKDSVYWAIHIPGQEMPVGTTALHSVLDFDRACSSGIIIWDPTVHGKGIASLAHLFRTWYASDMLNQNIIWSDVQTSNPGSWKALERVGYARLGVEPAASYRMGIYSDNFKLAWYHPERWNQIFTEERLASYPAHTRDAIYAARNKAQATLDLARKLFIPQ